MDMKNKRLIVVLGMHRSGTSAITRGLQAMGVSLGDALYGALKGVNEKGFWEDIHLNSLDVEMLGALGSDWHHLSPITEDDVEILRSNGYFLRAVDLLRQKTLAAPVFGIKDPRVAKLMPFWKEVFDFCHIDVSYVITMRHPISVAKSLVSRDGFDARKSYLLWLDHVIAGLVGSEKHKRVLVDYDRLMQSPEHELNRIADQLGLTVEPAQALHYANVFLDPELRHTVHRTQDLSLDAACPPLVRDIYMTLLDVASDHARFEDAAIREKVEGWVAEHGRDTVAFTLIDSLSAEKISALQALAARDAQMAEREDQIASLRQALTQRDVKVSSLEHSISEIRGSVSWRMTAPMRSLVTVLRKARSVVLVLPQIVQKGGGVCSTFRKAVNIVHREGFHGVKGRVRFVFRQSQQGSGNFRASDARVSMSRPIKPLVIPYYIAPRLDGDVAVCIKDASVAVHLFVDDLDILGKVVEYLNNVPFCYDLYVSVPESASADAIRLELNATLSNVKLVVESVPDRGNGVAPLIIQFGERLTQYEVIAHIPAAKSLLSTTNHANWFQSVMDQLFGQPESSGCRIAHIMRLLETKAKVVFPEGRNTHIKDAYGVSGACEEIKNTLGKYAPLPVHAFSNVALAEGGAFWARIDCLKDLLCAPLSWHDLSDGLIDTKGMSAYTLENWILNSVLRHDGQCIQIHSGDTIKDYLHYEDQRDYSSTIAHPDIKVLSYYLPQFHPIPENDLWHGKGFTEWTKVRAANPLFEGHYQQHIPHSDIGYYLLDSSDVLRKQAALMHKSGVHGQVFYHYWFGGKLILEEPSRLLLNTPDIHMPFCFCWANENWTRRWDGNENEILLGQNYSGEDAQDFIEYLIPFFKDPRYIKVDGRPMLYIYRPASIPNVQEYLDTWEKLCVDAGIPGPYVVAVLTRGAIDPNDFGMDAAVERVLHDWTAGGVVEIKSSLNAYWPINGSVLSYGDVADFYVNQTDTKSFTYFRSTVPMWDNTARYGSDAMMLHGSTPKRFQDWIESTIAYTQANLPSDRRFVLVNAWNEWAEGAHLEPDTRYGYSYLNSIGRALSNIAYASELNPVHVIPASTKLCISISEDALRQLNSDPLQRKRFFQCLSTSSVFGICNVGASTLELVEEIDSLTQIDTSSADFHLVFSQVAYFDCHVIEKMLQSAHAFGSTVVANSYGGRASLTAVSENGSIRSSDGDEAPMLLVPKSAKEHGIKNIRMRTDARCFIVLPNSNLRNQPVVTTIIRYHKSGDIGELKNALFCLYAMQDCAVAPYIAAQDLSAQQAQQLDELLASFIWTKEATPHVRHHRSAGGRMDLRSKMLNDSLKCVETKYAAFLDFDDLIMPSAYCWLVNRLNVTGKAVTFGRVYSTSYDSESELLLERKRVFEYGSTYEEFLVHNHAPLHSFMLDMDKLNLGGVVSYDDQRYMEDYLLTLQLFTKDNADWHSLNENCYIGDYIHSIDRAHTLALSSADERQSLFSDPEYQECERRIQEIRERIRRGKCL